MYKDYSSQPMTAPLIRDEHIQCKGCTYPGIGHAGQREEEHLNEDGQHSGVRKDNLVLHDVTIECMHVHVVLRHLIISC